MKSLSFRSCLSTFFLRMWEAISQTIFINIKSYTRVGCRKASTGRVVTKGRKENKKKIDVVSKTKDLISENTLSKFKIAADL